MMVKKSMNANWASQKGMRIRFLKGVGRMLVPVDIAIIKLKGKADGRGKEWACDISELTKLDLGLAKHLLWNGGD